MANAFKAKQAEQKLQQAKADLLKSKRGGLAGREAAITAYCKQTGSTRDQALRILANCSTSMPDFKRMFERA